MGRALFDTAVLIGILTIPIATPAAVCGGAGSEGIIVVESSGSYTCWPDSGGFFPGVLYSHGGRNTSVGGDLQGTCQALARAGYVAYAKLRLDSQTKTIPDHLLEVENAFDHLLGLPNVDSAHIGLIGYSRGGSLTYAVAETRRDLVDATVLLAPAPAGAFFAIQTADVTPIAAPIFLGVADNDIYQADHVGIVQTLESSLQLEGKAHQAIYYPDYPDSTCTGCDGHQIFQVVDDEFTDYWCDVESFLALYMGTVPEIPRLGSRALILMTCAIFGLGFLALRRGARPGVGRI